MTTPLKPCPQCAATVPDIEGPVHPYFAASPGCWAIYGQILEREYSDTAFWANHGQTVDAYALQHPGDGSRRAISSVMIHLVGATLLFQHHAPQSQRILMLQRLSKITKADPSLIPRLSSPDNLGETTVTDIAPLSKAQDHLVGVDNWARTTWQAWSAHHPVAESLIRRISHDA